MSMKMTGFFFIETYHMKKFTELGIPGFVQDNHSRSQKGVLRSSSNSFGKWVGQALSSEKPPIMGTIWICPWILRYE